MIRLLTLLAVVGSTHAAILAAEPVESCARCGCTDHLRKVCRWQCEEAENKIPAFSCQCEDIVIPGKSPACYESCGPHASSQWLGNHLNGLFPRHLWGLPCECRVKTVKVLLRSDKTMKKKVWKPVIETACKRCCSPCSTEFVDAPQEGLGLVDERPLAPALQATGLRSPARVMPRGTANSRISSKD
jgi:hypothetical protein